MVLRGPYILSIPVNKAARHGDHYITFPSAKTSLPLSAHVRHNALDKAITIRPRQGSR